MCCCGSVRIIQSGGPVAPFTFSVTAGNSPYNGGLGVITGPIVINNGDILHLFSLNTIDFDVTPGSVNTHAEVRIDPNPLNTLSVSVAGLMGSAAPFTFDIGHNVGANYTINNGDLWKISSSNNTIDTVNMGGLISGFNVRIDPTPGNAITTSVNGIYVPSGGINIYNSDGTITDPTRTVTVGASTLNFNADNGGFLSNVGITTNQFAVTYSDTSGYVGLNQTTSTSSVMENQHPGTDEGARVFTSDASGNDPIAGLQAFSGIYGTTGIDVNSGGVLGNYINFYNNLGPYFELRLNGSAGFPGEVLTSSGPGVSPVWAPVTVTANSLDNLFFTQDIDWDFGGNDWNISNIDNWNVAADDISFTSNTFDVSAPIACFSGITQNDALTRFLVQDPGGCLSWRDAATVGGDRDWLTIQTTNQENFEANNAYRVGGIGVVGFPHATAAPFDTNNLIFDIEVAGGTRNTIGVNTVSSPLGAEGSFQLLAPATGGNLAWSAISIGASVDTGFGSLPNLIGPFVSPASDNLMITHKSTTSGGGGDVPMYMLYGAGNTNAQAGHIFTDTGSVNSYSVPSELVTVGSVNRTPRIHIHNDNVVGDDEAGILFSTDGLNSRAHIGIGEYLNTTGNVVSALSPDLSVWSFLGSGASNTYLTQTKGGGIAITNGTGPTTTFAADLYVQGGYNNIEFGDYQNARDDSGTDVPINFLYTDLIGNLRSAPLTALPGGPIPINNLLSATGTNAIDNLNFNQTWEWNTLTNQNGLQLESSSITTGSLLQLDTNVSGARTGRLINVLSTNSTTGFRGIQVTTNDTSTEAVNITQVGQGRGLRVETANVGPGGTGAPLVEFERTNAASDAEIVQRIISAGNDTGLIVSSAATSATVAAFASTALTTGVVLSATSNSAFSNAVAEFVGFGQHTGQVLDVQSTTSTANFTNGGARFFFGGNHLGTGLLVQDFSTAGRAMLIDSGVTTGIGLKIEATSVSSGAAVDIETAASDGSIFINFSEGGVSQGSITNGAGNTVLYNTTSDRNLKENIELSDLKATTVINTIDVVEYNFKADQNKNTLHGLIAQDLYEIYPEAVTKGGGDKPWSIDYSKLVPVLLKSIQELSLRLLVLENK